MREHDFEVRQEIKEMVQCVQFYYKHHLNQKDIAKKLGISASKVSRLLKKAYAEGIVKVEVNIPKLPNLEFGLIERFGLRDAVVLASSEDSYIKEELGMAAARYFEKICGDRVKIGISCGFTLYYMVRQLREKIFNHLRLYPLAAESSMKLVDLSPNTLVGMMAAKYRPNVTAYALHAYLIGPLKEIDRERELIMGNPDIKRIFDEAADVDIALVGIGCIGEETPGFCSLAEYYGITPAQLKAMNIVGEINYQPFDEAGNIIDHEELRNLSRRVIAVPALRLKEMAKQFGKHVIAVAGGQQKIEAIEGAIKGKLFDILITDENVAKALLSDG
ncbi:MAG: winged helix-turn-helix transcriptional regulator [Candidatus Tectomicrobia bacterium]|nr:winged helix-turn-helix transcriptional regulator [Candidatus Tectomicrobia bacterium]